MAANAGGNGLNETPGNPDAADASGNRRTLPIHNDTLGVTGSSPVAPTQEDPPTDSVGGSFASRTSASASSGSTYGLDTISSPGSVSRSGQRALGSTVTPKIS